MRDRERKNHLRSGVLRAFKTLDIAALLAIFGIIWYQMLALEVFEPFFERGNWAVIALYVIVLLLFFRTYDAFFIYNSSISENFTSQALAIIMTDALFCVLTVLLIRGFYNPYPYLLCFGIQILVSALWCQLVHRWYARKCPPRKTIVVWDTRKGIRRLVKEKGLNAKFDIIADYPAEECLKDISLLNDAECVFIVGVHSHDRNVLIKYCVEHSISAFVIPRIGDILMSSAKKVNLFHLPMLELYRYSPTPEYLFLKRLFDIVSSALVLILVSPVLLVVSVLIKKEDGGPVFYRQVRLTKDGREFNLLKFRSMRVDAEKDGVARLSTGENDERITSIGKKIRACRIDEFPQLINIIKGDMSVVGPRPERPEIAAQYEEDLPEFHLRLQAKCGLTGYAQVYGKYNTTPYDKLMMDLMYIASPSIIQDLRLIFATFKILFVKESTEGVAEGQTTASSAKRRAPAESAEGNRQA